MRSLTTSFHPKGGLGRSWSLAVLDQERRTKEAVQASKVVVLERMDELEQSVEEIRTALAILTAGLAGLEMRILGAVNKN